MSLRWAQACWIALSLSLTMSCQQCGDEVVAEISVARGDVQRDHHAFPGQFAKAGTSDTLHLGDGLRTGPRSSAELKLFPDGVARIEERTLVRFMSERPADGIERLTIEEGVIELDATAIDLELDTGHGIARIKQGSRIRLRASEPEEIQLDVLVGRVQIERKGQADESAKTGETVTLAAKSAPEAAPEKAAVVPAEVIPEAMLSPDAAVAVPLAKPNESAAERADSEIVKSVDFKLAAAENAVIHATALPIDIAIPIGACSETASVELGASAKRRVLRADPNSNEVFVSLKAGAQKLRIRCGGKTRDLTLRVTRDAATQELPRTAQDVDVAADGRRYTVRYQNLLPSLAFSWPGAEPAPPYVLLIKRGQAREQRFESNKPQRQLKSGELLEGEYQFAFQASNGKRSANSSLRISFDNAARSAYLSAPAENSPRGSDIRVAGGALARSEVSVSGAPVATDHQGRFDAVVPHAASENAIAVRVSNPASGVHYYVRRLR